MLKSVKDVYIYCIVISKFVVMLPMYILFCFFSFSFSLSFLLKTSICFNENAVVQLFLFVNPQNYILLDRHNKCFYQGLFCQTMKIKLYCKICGKVTAKKKKEKKGDFLYIHICKTLSNIIMFFFHWFI